MGTPCKKGVPIAESLDSNDGAGDGIVLRDRILEKNLQGFARAAAEIGKKLPIIQKVTVEDLGDAKYEITVRNLFVTLAPMGRGLPSVCLIIPSVRPNRSTTTGHESRCPMAPPTKTARPGRRCFGIAKNLQGQAAVPNTHRKPDMVRIRFEDAVRALDRRLIQEEIQDVDVNLDLLPESPPQYRRKHGGAQRHGPGRCFDVDGRQDPLHGSAFPPLLVFPKNMLWVRNLPAVSPLSWGHLCRNRYWWCELGTGKIERRISS
jgi:hypothetical protein